MLYIESEKYKQEMEKENEKESVLPCKIQTKVIIIRETM